MEKKQIGLPRWESHRALQSFKVLHVVSEIVPSPRLRGSLLRRSPMQLVVGGFSRSGEQLHTHGYMGASCPTIRLLLGNYTILGALFW